MTRAVGWTVTFMVPGSMTDTVMLDAARGPLVTWTVALPEALTWDTPRARDECSLVGFVIGVGLDEAPAVLWDGGDIAWHALYSDGDIVILPYQSSCLNQRFKSDCSDPVNVAVHGLGHNEVPKDEEVFRIVAGLVMSRFPGRP